MDSQWRAEPLGDIASATTASPSLHMPRGVGLSDGTTAAAISSRHRGPTLEVTIIETPAQLPPPQAPELASR